MDGDSVADLVYFDGYERSYLSFYFNRNSSPTTPLLERINSGLGNVTEIEYGAAGLDGHYLYRGVSAANGAYRNHCLTQQEGVFSSLCDEYVSLTEDDFYDDLYSKEIFQLNDDDHSFGLDGNRDGAPEPVFVLNSMGNVVTSVSSSSPAGQGPEGQAGSVSANAKSKVSYFYADANNDGYMDLVRRFQKDGAYSMGAQTMTAAITSFQEIRYTQINNFEKRVFS